MSSVIKPIRAAPRPGKPGSRRAEKSIKNRHTLFQAAAQIVGEFGYAGASIARITSRAGLAQGTFYLYFESRQALFDQLLPEVGQELLDFLSSRIRSARDIFEVEERAIRASFEYLAANPGFYRILNEAEVAAPRAFDKHFRNVALRYMAALKRSHSEGWLPGYEERELELVAYMIMGARSYIFLWLARRPSRPARPPEWCVQTYVKFVRDVFARNLGGESPVDEKRPRRASGSRVRTRAAT